jgi:hypothetical protein
LLANAGYFKALQVYDRSVVGPKRRFDWLDFSFAPLIFQVQIYAAAGAFSAGAYGKFEIQTLLYLNQDLSGMGPSQKGNF